MPFLRIILFVFLSLILSACASSNDQLERIKDAVLKAVPEYPTSLENCTKDVIKLPESGGLNKGKTLKGWGHDRAAAGNNKRCYGDSAELYKGARKNVEKALE